METLVGPLERLSWGGGLMSMHIVLSTPFATPETGACSIRVDSLKESFIRQGHCVTILAPHRPGVASVSGTIRYTGRGGLFFTLAGLVHSPELRSFDAVIGVSPPLPPNFLAWLACLVRRKSFFLDSKDPFIDQALADGSLREGSAKHFIYRTLDVLVHRHARFIFTLTPRDKELIHTRHGVPLKKIEVTPNGFDPAHIFPDSALRTRMRKKLKIEKNERVVLYSGSLGDEKIHEWVNHFPPGFAERHKLQLILVVSSSDTPAGREHVRQLEESLAQKKMNARAHLVQNVPYSQINAYFCAADMGFVPVPQAWTTCLPVKALDYSGAGIPLLGMGPRTGSFDDFVHASKSGFVSDTWESFFSQWEKSLSDFPAFARKGKNALAFVRAHFVRAANNEKMVAIVSRLVGEKK